MKKLYPDANAALDGLLQDGLLIAAGGFGPGVCNGFLRRRLGRGVHPVGPQQGFELLLHHFAHLLQVIDLCKLPAR